MNESSALNPGQYSDSFSLKSNPSVCPVKFISIKKPEILFRLTRDFECTETEADNYFNSFSAEVTSLKEMRFFKIITYKYLEEIIHKYPVKLRLYLVLFLIKAVADNKRWMHVFNWCVNIANRDLPVPIPLLFIPENRLMEIYNSAEENPLIFSESLLNILYCAFNDNFIWQNVDPQTFKGWFRINPVGKPLINDEMTTYFCYALGKLSDYRFIDICPNIEKWYTKLSGKSTSFSKLKNQAVDPHKKEIDDRFSKLVFLME